MITTSETSPRKLTNNVLKRTREPCAVAVQILDGIPGFQLATPTPCAKSCVELWTKTDIVKARGRRGACDATRFALVQLIGLPTTSLPVVHLGPDRRYDRRRDWGVPLALTRAAVSTVDLTHVRLKR